MKNNVLKTTQQVINILADGEFHSGEAIAKEIGISRAGVWKIVSKLQAWAIEVYAVRGKGYKIPGGLQLLDQRALALFVEKDIQLFEKLDVYSTIDSTADQLKKLWQREPGVGRICVAEHQSKGRGRKGRPWISPFASNLYFSLGLNLPVGLNALGGLSLAIGMSLAKLFNQYTNNAVKVKWPNDLLIDNKKLAGILVEASGESHEESFLNIGVGVNWNMRGGQESIDQPWTNLKSRVAKPIDRHQMLIKILACLDQTLAFYLDVGFAGFQEDWPALSAYYGQSVRLVSPRQTISGIEVGVDTNGGLRIEASNDVKTYYSGEMSLRL